MNDSSIQTIAGAAATATFVLSALPMLGKAYRTKDLASYSPGSLTLATAGNALYWAYVAGLPFGPIWLLHAFNTATTLLMLFWHLAYRCARRRFAVGAARQRIAGPPDNAAPLIGGRRWLPPCPSE
jgi:hypothetical protein